MMNNSNVSSIVLNENIYLRISRSSTFYTKKICAFTLAEGVEDKIKNKRILILDDIFTTGTTMSKCAAVLKSNGAAEIYALALASDFKD